MPSFNARPEPPLWAIEAGLPAPRDSESYVAYLKRIGLDHEELLSDLTDTTACLANIRLATTLQRSLPDAFHQHIDAFVRARLSPDRRLHVADVAANLFPKP